VQFDFETMLASERYKLLLATVLPRPIAWVTTRDRRGAVNAAPFSFFNVFGNDPATVGIGIGSAGPAEPKDTRANIRETEQFVVNLVPFSLAQEMRVTSIAFPRGIEEPGEAGLSLGAPSKGALLWVKVPSRVDHNERSEAQLHEGDRVWEGSVERSCGPMNKNRIEGGADQGERAKNREALVIKGKRRRSGGRAVKECVLTWGDLALCLKGRRCRAGARSQQRP
jgi:hypothetical protein